MRAWFYPVFAIEVLVELISGHRIWGWNLIGIFVFSIGVALYWILLLRIADRLKYKRPLRKKDWLDLILYSIIVFSTYQLKVYLSTLTV